MSADTAPAEMPGVENLVDNPLANAIATIIEQSLERHGIIPDGIEGTLDDAGDILDLFAPILAEKERELREARSRLRWNVEDDGRLVRICEGLHEKSEDCEFDTYVPEARALAAEAALAAERERCAGIADAEARRQPNSQFYTHHELGAAQAARRIAAAIRAEGE